MMEGFIGRSDAARRAGVAPQLLDYWTKKFPALETKRDANGRVFVNEKELDAIIELKRRLKGAMS